MKHLEKEKQDKNQKFSKIITFMIGFIVIALSFIQIIIANQTASSGERMRNIDSEKERIIEENQQLEIEIAKNSSLVEIEKKANKIGFIPANSFIFLNAPLPVALKIN